MGMDTLYLVSLGGKERRKILNVDSTTVDNRGKYIQSDNSAFVDTRKDNTSFSDDGFMLPKRKERGWGEALFLSYGTFLDVLQSALLDDWQQDMFNLKRRDKTKSIQDHGDKSTGVLRQLVDKPIGGTNESLLTEQELTHFEHFLFSVHVFGYNWLEDNDLLDDTVHKFMVHQEKKQYHTNSYVFYGTEVESDNTLRWGAEKVVPLKVGPRRPFVFNPENNQRIVYSGENEVKNALGKYDSSSYQYTQFRLASSQGAGDGTVPVESLVDIISSPSVKSSLATNVDHQNAYAVDSLPNIRERKAIQFTLRAVVKMVQEVDIHAAD